MKLENIIAWIIGAILSFCLILLLATTYARIFSFIAVFITWLFIAVLFVFVIEGYIIFPLKRKR